MKLEIVELPYLKNTTPLLQALQCKGDLVALESCATGHENGRWSIISAEPLESYRPTEIKNKEKLWQTLDKMHASIPFTRSNLPFIGGLLGQITYDLGLTNSRCELNLKKIPRLPIVIVGLYTWAFLIDHKEKNSRLVFWNMSTKTSKSELIQIFNSTSLKKDDFLLTRKFQPRWSADNYKNKIKAIHKYIADGDAYQVNLAQCFIAKYKGNHLNAYTKLKEQANVPFASYIESEYHAFASASPELFLSVTDGKIVSKPIKGTRPRHHDTLIDNENKKELASSSKDRAENLMIVDLLRNDLSKNAKTVSVPDLFKVESFSTVHHLVSTINATLSDSVSPLKLFLDAFPGGSITGAPKKRAMEIIAELEEFPRSYYCGSAFYYSANRNFNSNILIRGFLFNEGEVHCWAGGGIIQDSTWQAEYQESLDKISKLMKSLYY